MSSIDPIANYASQGAGSLADSKNHKNANELGIDEFLTLMTTQLKNQDPMKPLDGTAFISQLAEFGSVAGIQKMQTSMETLAASLRSTQALNGASLVGRTVMAPAEGVNHVQGATESGEIVVPAGVTEIDVRITDDAGEVVRTMTIPVTGGEAPFTWDGLKTNGTPAPSGAYAIEAIGRAGGQSGSLPMLVAARVSSVSIDGAGGGLTLNTQALGAVSLSDVRRVI